MKKIIIFAAVASLLLAQRLEAGTNIDQNPNIIPSAGLDTLKFFIQKASDSLGPAMADAYGLGNISGYPMGSSHIKFFFIGISVNSGLTNTYFFDPTVNKTEWTFPGFGINPVIFFGFSLGDRMDLMAKVMVYNDAIYKPPLEMAPIASLTKINLYSAGAKFRFTPVKNVPIFPGLFEFGGITITAGVDAIYGILGFQGTYPYPIPSVDLGGGVVVNVSFNPQYQLMLSWWLISPSIQALFYFDFFWIFSIYTGFGLAVHLGSFDLNLTATGDVDTTDPAWLGAHPITKITATSVTSYAPSIIMPLYILGLDINLYVLQISVETMVNLMNLRDINIQIGVRSQW
jgi:hypothetical protein